MLDLTSAFLTFPVLESERLILREIKNTDSSEIFRIMSDTQVTRYFGTTPMVSAEEAEQQVASFATSFETHTGIRWGITQRGNDRLLGTCGFWRLMKPHFGAEIGYELAPEWWGRGVMTEALRPVLTFGFSRMGLHRVEAQIHPANIGSRRVLEKLGFIQEGYFRENYFEPTDGTFSDTAVLSLLKGAR